MHMLERARDKGVRLMQGRVETIGTTGGRVSAVTVSGRTIATPRVVNAAGPVLARGGRLLGGGPPGFRGQPAKTAVAAPLRAMPRAAPPPIWTDPVGGGR